jgi:hypothetical protein
MKQLSPSSGKGLGETFLFLPGLLPLPKSLIMKFSFIVLILLSVPSFSFAQGVVTPEFGDVFGLSSSLDYTQSVPIADGYAVFNFFQTGNAENAVLIVDENGLIQTRVPIETDSTYYEPLLFSDGNTLFLAGYEGPSPAVFDSVNLSQRSWVIRSYDATAGMQELSRSPVLPGEIGVPVAERSYGINIQSSYYQPITQVAVASDSSITAITENLTVILDDSSGVPSVSQGNTVVTILDKHTGTVNRFANLAAEKLRDLADIVSVGGKTILYSYRGNSGFSIHTLGKEGDVLSSETDSSVFRGTDYAHYAIAIGEDSMVEVAATSSGLLLDEMKGTSVSIRNSAREVLLEKPEIPDEAPFGPTSLTASADGALFLATASLLADRSSFPITLHKIDLESLETLWSLPLSRDTFGLYQSLVATPDGGAIVFGSSESGEDFLSKVTKINPNNTTSTQQIYTQLQDWLLGPNPSTGAIHIHPDALRQQPNLRLMCYDYSGRLLIDRKVDADQLTLSGLRGAHIVQLATSDGRVLDSQVWMFH